MKLKFKLNLCLLLLAAPLGLRAITTEQDYLNLYAHRESLEQPVPVAVHSPSVSNKFAGQHLLLEFVVDGHGRPRQFKSRTPGADQSLVETVERAVGTWEFAPGLEHGLPTNRRVTLPIEIVASTR